MVDGPKKAGGVPKGYTAIKLFDTNTKKVTGTYFVPVGKKITLNGQEYDPSKGKNNEIVFTGEKGEKGFEMLGLALGHMDVNGDGKIDTQDTNGNLAPKINRALNQKGITNYYVKFNGFYSDAGVSKGTGGVVFRNENTDAFYNVEIDE